MKIKHLVLGLLMGAALGFGTACSDDDDVKVDAAVKKDSGAVKKDGGAVIKDSGVVKGTAARSSRTAARSWRTAPRVSSLPDAVPWPVVALAPRAFPRSPA
ncbi:MAG: hypothetical protein IPG96_20870 [Proteobacteria bacterium]|nr:hypothetical protein [Pseudomonadota bacterium]